MKPYAVVFTPNAERDLENLYRYIADNAGEARAADYVGKIVRNCQALATFPERGAQRDDVRPGLRTMGYARSATLAFSVNKETQTVAVYGIFYGGRDFAQLLQDDPPDD